MKNDRLLKLMNESLSEAKEKHPNMDYEFTVQFGIIDSHREEPYSINPQDILDIIPSTFKLNDFNGSRCATIKLRINEIDDEGVMIDLYDIHEEWELGAK